MKTRLALLLSIVLLVTPAAGAETVVFGLTLGKPLPVRECPKSPFFSGGSVTYDPVKTLCAQGGYPTQAAPINVGEAVVVAFPPDQRPAHAAGNVVATTMMDGVLEAVRVATTGHSSQEAVYRDLVAKFGEPTQRTLVPKSNAYGATVQSIEAVWDKGDELQVFLWGVRDRIDHGTMMIGSKRGINEFTARMNRITGASTRTPL